MLLPTFENLKRLITESKSMFCSGSPSWIQDNPRFYKFRWWIFSEECTAEGYDFLGREEFSLCTHDAINLIERLKKERRSFMIYHRRRRRSGPDTPFKKWDRTGEDPGYAPPFDEDQDPIYKGHK